MIGMCKDVYGYVYMVRNKINGKIYFGITIYDFYIRYKGNIAKYTHNEHLQNSINTYGIENFEINEEFDVAYNEDDLWDLEDMYICLYNTLDKHYGYNKRRSGSKRKGCGKHSEESIQKMREARKKYVGKLHPMFGKTFSDEARKNMRDGHKRLYENGYVNPSKGLTRSSENRLQISKTLKDKYAKGELVASFKGKHLTEETRQKLSEAHMGKQLSEEHKQHIREAVSGEGNPMYGKHHSEESKQKISEALKGKMSGEKHWNYGKQHSEESKQKMSESQKRLYEQGYVNPNKDKPMSEEQKEKISNSRKGKYCGKDNSHAKAIICLNTLEVFDTIKEAMEWCNGSKKIIACCKGKGKTSGKHPITKEPLQWMYYKDYLKLQEQQNEE